MKKRSVLSLLLALSILLSLALPTATTAYAEGESKTNSGLEMKKTATANDDGTYTITLEAYATGDKVISQVTKDVPTDIVLVLDQSGSMDYCMVCGKEIKSNRQTHNTYTETYSVNSNEKYYVKNSSSYTEVTYCDGEHFGGSCSGGAGWYISGGYRWDHTAEAKITPKTSSTSNGTQFYVAGSERCSSRLNALKTSADSFVNAVAEKAKGTDGKTVNHRIAVVGYAGSSSNLTNGFKEMDDASQVSSVSAAIDNLTANGGTHINQGIETANSIFASNPIGENEKRNRVVIVFTDGAPGSYGNWGSESVQTANSAITNAAKTKAAVADGGYGATVYTIGIFSGADASNPNSLPNYTAYSSGYWGENVPSEADQVKNSNRFMHLVSSNYPAASSITNPGTINSKLEGKSYYLSAGDSDSLNSIFQQISSEVQGGSTSTTLTKDTVIKDIISPQFTLPEGTTTEKITLETYKYKGGDLKNLDSWELNSGDTMGATVNITSTDASHETTKENQVNVTGFDFSENWCGIEDNSGTKTPHGNKLVISFTVKPRDGFLGGNGVYTNTEAGIYENDKAKDPVDKFERPDVDVTIKEPTVTVPDANVFLGAYFEDTVSADQLKEGTTIKFGDDIVLDMTQPNNNWGLEPWQTEYVKITVKVTDKDGNEVTDFKNLKEDTDYKVSVSIKPETPKEGNNGYDKGMEGTIHVFTPELTYKDSTAYYGESVPQNNDYSANLTETKWKHVDGDQTKYSTDAGVTMLGSQTAPTLDIKYTPDASKLDDGKYTKQDVPVTAMVSIKGVDVTGYTTFLHQKCDVEGCTWTEPTTGDPAFMIHIKTCQLTITKTGGNNGEPYVFDVIKDGKKYTQVTVVGNTSETIYELPVGTYTIQEDTGWSWRFTPTIIGNGVELKNGSDSGTITCTNKLDINQWLNGFSQVIRNIFGAKH